MPGMPGRFASPYFHATTVACVRHRGRVAVAGDGQVSIGQTIVKAGARKVRKVYHDRVLRRLEALLAVADAESSFIVSGTGDVIEPDDGLIGIGSGGPFALAAARALCAHSTLEAAEIAEHALRIAAGICVYTNDHITVEALP